MLCSKASERIQVRLHAPSSLTKVLGFTGPVSPPTETTQFRYLLGGVDGEALANQHFTSEFILFLQFKQLVIIKCSTRQQQTSFTSKYIRSPAGKDLSKQVLAPRQGANSFLVQLTGPHQPWGLCRRRS